MMPLITSSNSFGKSLDMDGENLVVGDGFRLESGGAIERAIYLYVLENNQWNYSKSFNRSNDKPNDSFANYISISGGVIVSSSNEDYFGELLSSSTHRAG